MVPDEALELNSIDGAITFPEFSVRFRQLLMREGRGCKDEGGTVKKQ